MDMANYELKTLFASLLRFCAFVPLVLLRTVLESIRDSGDLVIVTIEARLLTTRPCN